MKEYRDRVDLISYDVYEVVLNLQHQITTLRKRIELLEKVIHENGGGVSEANGGVDQKI